MYHRNAKLANYLYIYSSREQICNSNALPEIYVRGTQKDAEKGRRKKRVHSTGVRERHFSAKTVNF